MSTPQEKSSRYYMKVVRPFLKGMFALRDREHKVHKKPTNNGVPQRTIKQKI